MFATSSHFFSAWSQLNVPEGLIIIARSPVAPPGDPDTLNDHHCDLSKEDEEEGKETEGAVGPKRTNQSVGHRKSPAETT